MSQILKRENNQIVPGSELTRDEATFVPQVDIWEDDHEIVLYADLPGVEEDDLDIQFENRQLTIHAKVKNRHADINFIGGEYGIGDFYRAFMIGDSIDAGKIHAELKQGELVVHLPKLEEVKPRKIPVKGAS